jgi:hypothetical protein
MSRVNLSKVVNWPDKVSMLPSLLEDLRLTNCLLAMLVPPTFINANCSSPLSLLDLSSNQLNSSIFPWLFKYTNSLVHLDLRFNKIQGPIPKALGNMVALVHLDLSFNNLEGSIPKALGNMVALVHLNLFINNLEGSRDTSMYFDLQYIEKVWVNTKGRHLEYDKILDLVKVIEQMSLYLVKTEVKMNKAIGMFEQPREY